MRDGVEADPEQPLHGLLERLSLVAAQPHPAVELRLGVLLLDPIEVHHGEPNGPVAAQEHQVGSEGADPDDDDLLHRPKGVFGRTKMRL